MRKNKDEIPTAGFPYQSLDKFLKILVKDLDVHVVLCDEYHERDAHGDLTTPIERKVSRVITAATLIDENFLDKDQNNYLLSIYPGTSAEEETFGLAWIDISTGEFYVETANRQNLSSALMRIGASQVLVADGVDEKMREDITLTLGISQERVSSLNEKDGNSTIDWLDRMDEPLEQDFKIELHESKAAQQLYDYIDTHILDVEIKPMHPQRKLSEDIMEIDRAGIKGLELLMTARTSRTKGSLMNTIKRTVTDGGARLLKDRLSYPSINPEVIEGRLDLLQAFLDSESLRYAVVVRLKKLHDMHRISQKFAYKRGDAQDLLQLTSTISKMKEIVELLQPHSNGTSPPSIAIATLLARLQMDELTAICTKIDSSLDTDALNTWLSQENFEEESPNMEATMEVNAESLGSPEIIAHSGDPWVMQPNASPALSFLHDKIQQVLVQKKELQARLREEFSMPKLSLRYDKRFGHICHTPTNKKFDDKWFLKSGAYEIGRHKTVKSYSFPEWSKLGRELYRVEYEIRLEEQKVMDQLKELVNSNITLLHHNGAIMDELDLSIGFATLAETEGWSRPMINTTTEHKINGGWHPTVVKGLKEKDEFKSFTKNSLYLDKTQLTWLITGPNMAGKSTFLRQNALITILAQMGCYVPAIRAEIGIVDKIFSRIGAADDLYRNESTFMVEMLETAAILRNATNRSFVIMDEVGRGTAPVDGAAVAFASLHHLYHTNKCRTLFATHFHGLADKTADWSRLAQYCTDIEIDGPDTWHFQHALRKGVNRNSHAFRIAGLAKLPEAALRVAQQALADSTLNG